MLTDQLLALAGALALSGAPQTPPQAKPEVAPVTPPAVSQGQSPQIVIYPPVPSIVVEDLKQGQGKAVEEGDRVTVHFEATDAMSGESLANTKLRGLPFTFVVSKEGDVLAKIATGMRSGGRRQAVIVPELLNEGQGLPPIIPARKTIRIEMRLISVVPKGSR